MKVLGRDQKLYILIAAGTLGAFLYYFSFLITGFAFGIMAVFCLLIVRSGNRNGEAHYFSAYILGIETFFRASNASSIPFETGKYAIILLLLLGIQVEKTRINYNYMIYFYILLLTPSFIMLDEDIVSYLDEKFVHEIRKIILFNMSGPFCLAVTVFYFYSRKLHVEDLVRLIYFTTTALVTYLVYLQLKVFEFGDIVFSAWGSNAKASGGFAANQVSVTMGIGMLMILVSIYLKKPVSGFLWVDFFLLSFFAYRGIQTFSRGGVMVPVFTFLLPIYYYYKHTVFDLKAQRVFRQLRVVGIIIIGVWFYIDHKTDGQLTKRYEGETGSFEATGKRQIVTDRDVIAMADLAVFMDYPIVGAGPGMAIYLRTTHGYHEQVAAHTEYTRVLAEHGLFGLMSLLILFYILISSFLNHRSIVGRVICFVFMVFGLLTLGHNGMRTAAGAFTIGLSTIIIVGAGPGKLTPTAEAEVSEKSNKNELRHSLK